MFRMSEEITKFKLKPLGECVEILDRLRKPINIDKRKVRQGDIPYYGANGQIGTIDEWIFDEDLILVAEDGGFFNDPIRPISYRISGKSWVNNHAHVLRPINGNDIDWLNYAICQQDIRHLIKGATLKKLNQKNLKEILVPCPSENEQRRIVARIKECMERVEEMEELQNSVLDEAFLLPTAFRYDLWNECAKSAKMVELCSVTDSTKNGLYKPKKFHGQGVILLRMFNINGASLNLDRIARLEVSEKEALEYQVSNGDIIVSRVNSRELVGKSALVEGLQEEAVHEAMIIRLRVCDAQVDKRFLLWLINSPQFLYDLRGRAKHAIGQSSINQKDLLSSTIPLPSIEEQRIKVESMSDLPSLAADLLTECSERHSISVGLRESILRKAFAGEL